MPVTAQKLKSQNDGVHLLDLQEALFFLGSQHSSADSREEETLKEGVAFAYVILEWTMHAHSAVNWEGNARKRDIWGHLWSNPETERSPAIFSISLS